MANSPSPLLHPSPPTTTSFDAVTSFSLTTSYTFYSDDGCNVPDGDTAKWVYDEASIPPTYSGTAIICDKDLDKGKGSVHVEMVLNLPFTSCTLLQAAVNPFLNICEQDIPVPGVVIPAGSSKMTVFTCETIPR